MGGKFILLVRKIGSRIFANYEDFAGLVFKATQKVKQHEKRISDKGE